MYLLLEYIKNLLFIYIFVYINKVINYLYIMNLNQQGFIAPKQSLETSKTKDVYSSPRTESIVVNTQDVILDSADPWGPEQ